jgi:hypothetical protein
MRDRLILALALLLICTGAALAQTPDGETPADETVCDMDCESDEPAASATACTKVRTKFQNITGHDLPCEAASCPCSGHPDWEAVLAGTVFNCIDGGDNALLQTSGGTAVADSRPGIASCGGNTFFFPATPEEGAVCVDLITALCGPAG